MNTVVFDFGALTLSKQSIDNEMASLLDKLLAKYTVAVISSYSWKQLNTSLIIPLSGSKNLDKLFVIGSSGAEMYQTWGKYGWVPTFQDKLESTDYIKKVLDDVVKNFKYAEKIWGKQIEVQDCQVVFSVLGQNVPYEQAVEFDPLYKIRNVIKDNIQKRLPENEVIISDLSTVSITKKDADRKGGLDEFMKRTHLSKNDIMYVGIDIEDGKIGGPAIEIGFDYHQVTDFEETKEWIRSILTDKVKVAASV
jgi:hydroxymethylpyrimidine pyrophosphatase-like HAD family hydrolase